MAGHAFDAVRGVDVFDEGDLVAGRGALAGDDGRVGEEVLPDLEWGGGFGLVGVYVDLTRKKEKWKKMGTAIELLD